MLFPVELTDASGYIEIDNTLYPARLVDLSTGKVEKSETIYPARLA